MKNLTPILFALLAVGCSQHSPYDISPDQVERHVVKGGPGDIDLKHLPPGAVKHETLIKKGERMPDGSIATHDAKLIRVEVNKTAP